MSHTNMIAGVVDYKAKTERQHNRKSAKGRDYRRPGDALNYLIWKLAIEMNADGDENYFIFNPHADARFTKSAFLKIVPILWEKLPEECTKYFGGREEQAEELVADRFHKKYYAWSPTNKCRAKSGEHPDYWSGERLLKVYQRLYGEGYESTFSKKVVSGHAR